MVPRLRFREFNTEWREMTLAQIFSTFKSGKGITSNTISPSGQYPVYGGNGLRGYTDTYTHSGEYFLIGRQGALCGNITKISGKAYISEHAIACQANIDNHTNFHAEKLSKLNLDRITESSAQPGLSVDKLKKMVISVPERNEQIKIADFLSSVDEKITLLNKQYDLLCQYKKGIMQKIFSQKLRFKDDNGKPFHKWSTLQLKDVAIRVTRKNKENNNTILTISGRDGLVDQMTYFNKQIASKNVTGYYLIRKGEFAYNKSYSQGYPMGAIKMLSSYEKGVVSTLYICFKLNDEQSCDFYQHYFESGLQNRAIEKVAQEGARNHGLLNIGVNDFFDIELQVPGLAEQNKIAHFLSAIEDKIAIKRAELNMLKNWKQGLLQQMFV